ncbi:MAG: hypothetical protein LBN18_03245 [Dysgonamonadaceae bacterium]|nr:hypothetical protein [Dysgonamonadaceae bacterium]
MKTKTIMIFVFTICFACTACNNRNEEENPTVTEEDNGPIKLGLYTEVSPTKGYSQIKLTKDTFFLIENYGLTSIKYKYEFADGYIKLFDTGDGYRLNFKAINDSEFALENFYMTDDSDDQPWEIPDIIYKKE